MLRSEVLSSDGFGARPDPESPAARSDFSQPGPARARLFPARPITRLLRASKIGPADVAGRQNEIIRKFGTKMFGLWETIKDTYPKALTDV